MKATFATLMLAALTAASPTTAAANGPDCRPSGPACIPTAPDTYGPYFYSVYPQGGVYGPNYNLRPCFPPFNGMVFGPNDAKQGAFNKMSPAMQQAVMMQQMAPGMPGLQGAPGIPPRAGALPGLKPGAPPPPAFPTHPFARSPRDFFMID